MGESENDRLIREVEPLVFSVTTKKQAEELLVSLQALQKLAARDDGTAEALRFLNCQGRCLKLLTYPDDQVVDAASAVLANLAGTAAANAKTYTWSYKHASLTLHEGAYVEAGLGYRVWPSATLMARMIIDEEIDVQGQDVLELGCGVGILGLVCAAAGSNSVLMTDYHQAVLKVVQQNIDANNVRDVVSVCKLDWRDYMSSEMVLKGISKEDYQYELRDGSYQPHGKCGCSPVRTSFRCIVASDTVYDSGHAELLPPVIDSFLSHDPDAVCHLVLPTIRYRNGIDVFDRGIDELFDVTRRRDDTVIGREAEHTIYTIRRRRPTPQ